jgi:hypothetical protein
VFAHFSDAQGLVGDAVELLEEVFTAGVLLVCDLREFSAQVLGVCSGE